MADDLRRRPEEVWGAAAASASRSVYVLAVGFDPRCLIGLRRFLTVVSDPRPLIVRVGLPASSAPDELTDELAARNQNEFRQLVDRCEVVELDAPSVHDVSSLGTAVARQVQASGIFSQNAHVIIDVSSLPSSMYFPLLRLGLLASDGETDDAFGGELQIVACENPSIDAAIAAEVIEEVISVGGFRNGLDLTTAGATTRIWAPVLGERSGSSLDLIFTRLAPDDTCPVLPFPAVDPRRGDSLVLEHHVALFERFQVTRGNFIYADESNPFDLYRTLSKFQQDYKEALLPLGETQVVLSSHSSKLLSLGVLLAAYEHRLPVVSVSAGGHRWAGSIDEGSRDHGGASRVACLWIAGRPYGGHAEATGQPPAPPLRLGGDE